MMRIFIAALIIGLCSFSVNAQTEDSVRTKKWYVPDYAKLHFAGGIGFLSPGVGIELFPKNNGELDVFAGFVPEGIGGDNLVSVAAKFHYMPWKKKLFKPEYHIEPLTLGLNVYYTFGEDINKFRDRDLYPEDYYGWTIATRFGPFIGGRVSKDYGKDSKIKTIVFYYEIGTNDLFIYSWIENHLTIPFTRLWDSSFGLKFKF